MKNSIVKSPATADNNSLSKNVKLVMMAIIIVLSLYSGLAVLLSSSSTNSAMILPAYAPQDLQTIKSRNLVIDLGNGVKTKSQLTIPALGKGPFPAVLLVHGSGAIDMNETLRKNTKPFWQISQYLSMRGFAVLSGGLIWYVVVFDLALN
jgi:uncharacterized protein